MINETYAHPLSVTRIGTATYVLCHKLQNLEITILKIKKEHRSLDAPIFIMNPHGLLRTLSPDVTLAASSAQAPPRHTKGPA